MKSVVASFLSIFCIGILFANSVAAVFAQAPTPLPVRLQFIHAAADPALNSVNIWGGRGSVFTPMLPNATFGSASSLLTSLGTVVPSLDSGVGTGLTANYTYTSSTGAFPAVASLPFALGRCDNIVVALGILRPRLFATNPNQRGTALELVQLFDTTRSTADTAVRLMLVHGVSDAPRMDVVVRETGAVLATLEYTQNAVARLPVGDYTIDIRYSTSQSVVASFAAPLQTLNMGGQRITCVVSGFLNIFKNQDGPALSVIAVPTRPIAVDSVTTAPSIFLPQVALPSFTKFPRTRIQIIDNAADVSRAPLTTFLTARFANSTNALTVPIGQQLRFRQATQTISTTPVIAIVSQRPLVVTIAIIELDNVVGSQLSTFVQRLPGPGRPAPIRNIVPTATLERGWNKVIATGVIDTVNYAKNPDGVSLGTRFTGFVDRADSVASDSVRLLLFQGVSDAKRMDIEVRGGAALASLKYTEGKFITLPAQQFTLDFTTFGTDDVVGSFTVPLEDYAGQRISVMTSGFVEPSKNSSGQPFSLMLVPESPSTTNRITLLNAAPSPTGIAETSLQTINASADHGLENIGFSVTYLTTTTGGVFLPVKPALTFRTADTAVAGLGTFAPFLKDIAGAAMVAHITRPRANSANAALYRQTGFSVIRGTNVVLASGFLRPTLYAPNPDSIWTGAYLYQFVDRVRTTSPDSVRLLAFHSVTDAPRVSIVARGNAAAASVTLATLSYGQGAWLTVPLADYTLDLVAVRSGEVVGSYRAPLASRGMGGRRMTLTATGVMNPARNQWAQPLGIYAAANAAVRGIVETQTSSQTTTVPALPNAQAITATGTTVSTTAIVITTSANGETRTTVTTTELIFTPNPLASTVKPGTVVFPKTATAIMTTIETVIVTINDSFRSDVTTTSISLIDGSLTITTTSTAHIYATNSSLVLSAMLERVDPPVKAASAFGSKVSENSISQAAVYPNPALNQASLSYTLQENETVNVNLYDALGQLVMKLETASTKAAGTYSLDFGTQNLQFGMYEARISTQSGVKAVKVMITR
jgi:hypothetical protein